MSKAAYKRRDDVLKIIVSDYIATATPVASEDDFAPSQPGCKPGYDPQ